MSFNHRSIETKWQQYWEDNKTFKTGEEAENVNSMP